MWKKVLVIILLFYIFALLQSSFFTHFSLFGTVPNLVFILFFLLVFFEKKLNPQVIFLALTAGIFLDVFSSYIYLGSSIVLLIIIGFLLKKTQSLLKNREDNHPLAYFLPLFLVYFVVYQAINSMSFDLRFLFGIIYNLVFAALFFYVYKKWVKYIG